MKSLILLALSFTILFCRIGLAIPVFATDIEKTFKTAKKEKKPLLVEFYGIWCPPCNELEETVFETQAFVKKAKPFKLLRVDADKKASWQLKDRYKIGGYPTLLFTRPDGKEIFRVVGYRTAKELFRTMDMVLAARESDVTDACQSDETEKLWRCALVCRERKDIPCAERAFKKLEGKVEPASIRFQEAREFFVEHAPTADLKRNGYERLLEQFPASPKAIGWSLDYLELLEEQKGLVPKRKLIETVLSYYSVIAADPRTEELGGTLSELAEYRALILEKLGEKERAKVAWIEAAALFQKAADELFDSPARGFTLERIFCLERAGNLEAALKLSRAYQQKYPHEFTFYFSTASLLDRAKHYQQAIKEAERAFELSYGDNRIRAATLLVHLYGALANKDAAKKIYEQTKKEFQPEGLEVRTHRYLEKLDAAWRKLS